MIIMVSDFCVLASASTVLGSILMIVNFRDAGLSSRMPPLITWTLEVTLRKNKWYNYMKTRTYGMRSPLFHYRDGTNPIRVGL